MRSERLVGGVAAVMEAVHFPFPFPPAGAGEQLAGDVSARVVSVVVSIFFAGGLIRLDFGVSE